MNTLVRVVTLLSLILAGCLVSVQAHGRLADPPSRNAMWMYKFPNPVNYNPNEMNCGGTKNHWEVHGGKCGMCGDPYQGPRKHEADYPGGYANGVIGRVYKQGQTIPIMVEITANHFGWFEFRMCPTNDPNRAVTQQCFDRYLLADASGQTRHRLILEGLKGAVKMNLVLPPDVTCSHCVIQWFWYSGNSRDRIAQETFVNCADVVITKRDGTLPAGLTMPNIPAQASQPIPEADHTLGQGRTIGLPGEWDCTVPPPHGNTAKKNVFYEWCIENCLYADPKDRSCPVETCRCFRTDVKLNEKKERELLGITEPYPEVNAQGNIVSSEVGRLEGSWSCDVASPFDQDPIKKEMFFEWCMTNCINARPHERDCPLSHCSCYRTDITLTPAEISAALKRTSAPVSRQTSKVLTTASPIDPNDHSWKSQSTMPIRPNGLKGSWDCDVKSPYDAQVDKRLFYYDWCVENCINADPNDRHCAETHCDCYRTDKSFSVEEIQAQLSLNGQVVIFTEQDGKDRGIPPSLVAIMNYAGNMNTLSEQPGLEGTWKCNAVFPFNKVEEKRIYYETWCMDMCVKAQPNDRYCPDTHCKCYRTDVRQSDTENRRQLNMGMTVQGIIHAESGEEGTLAQDSNTPDIGDMDGLANEDPYSGYVCDVVEPFDDPSRHDTVLQYCYDSCVLAEADERNCPETHCRCYEKNNPSNVLRTAVRSQPSRTSQLLRASRNRR